MLVHSFYRLRGLKVENKMTAAAKFISVGILVCFLSLCIAFFALYCSCRTLQRVHFRTLITQFHRLSKCLLSLSQYSSFSLLKLSVHSFQQRHRNTSPFRCSSLWYQNQNFLNLILIYWLIIDSTAGFLPPCKHQLQQKKS